MKLSGVARNDSVANIGLIVGISCHGRFDYVNGNSNLGYSGVYLSGVSIYIFYTLSNFGSQSGERGTQI
jgi:hypothetical protein